uniref:TLC domain-containing protein n=1 Tax=Steinernema glaseri TaxID=37863 RepID=A0A1I7ZLZ6_9BILA
MYCCSAASPLTDGSCQRLGIAATNNFSNRHNSDIMENEFHYIHAVSVWVMFSLCIAYIWSQTLFTYFIRAPFISVRFIFLFRFAISLVATACFASGRTIYIKSEQTNNDIMTRTILRWSIYALFCVYLISEAYELWFTEVKALKLVIPGGVLYDEARLRPRLRAATFASITEYGEEEEEALLATTLVP